ncbi:hypothetical protein HETIRDRAFT_163506 [Heterobasidion irregulare TC 32-1]|uniref:Uncharacterized protein n=1 Tax=Heterobasidion irregulare (strain TC 32-1) TaxID=747525 RepID=W4KBJ1_HETIT|nr:uncharacterized protein HETIRDRAFT_163506 [Heterobasidion irregulare TC 32-1]ETW83099.1 hypothetical protein HETIRDRAFT_163506 [Heterobasidion irregulare TC 32-1]
MLRKSIQRMRSRCRFHRFSIVAHPLLQHYVRLYSTGNTTDCNSPHCAFSAAHMHKTARTCMCHRVMYDDRRVLNLFQEPCDDCKEAGFDRGRRR